MKTNDPKIKFSTPTNESLFARQELISWWSQKKLSEAKIMVVGAGAIGNEVLKNLALLGIGYIFVVDFDEVSPSNLSRTVLFRTEDIGKKKAEVAAQRTKELALAENFKIDWFHGDIIWELGTGVYRRMDIVLGCLDNVETRYAVNRACYLAGVPWIDAGIKELDGSVSCYLPAEGPCYGCTASKALALEKKNRYSCDTFKRKQFAEDKIATVQIAAARVAALQVQEAIRFLHNDTENKGTRLFFQGKLNSLDRLILPTNPNCFIHELSLPPNIIPLRLNCKNTLEELLKEISNYHNPNSGVILDISGETWTFIEYIEVNQKQIPISKPNFQIYDDEILPLITEAESWTKKEITFFSLTDTPSVLLSKTLTEIGVPKGHIISVFLGDGNYIHFELSGDLTTLIPGVTHTKEY